MLPLLFQHDIHFNKVAKENKHSKQQKITNAHSKGNQNDSRWEDDDNKKFKFSKKSLKKWVVI